MTVRKMLVFAGQHLQMKGKKSCGACTESSSLVILYTGASINIVCEAEVAMSILTEEQKLMHPYGISNVCFPSSPSDFTLQKTGWSLKATSLLK